MSKREFTPEEIAKSLRVCCAVDAQCDGCCLKGVYPGVDLVCNEHLEKRAADLIEELADEVARFLAELIQRNDELAKLREENRWIPVTERLPATDDGPYSAYEEEFAVQVLAVIEGAEWATELYFDGYDFFDIQGGEAIPYRVSHWKPMLKGPEVGHE